jgi:hypothetical protein
MENKKTTFAFKLASQQDKQTPAKKWTTREGLAVAACTLSGDLRYPGAVPPYKDNGDYC